METSIGETFRDGTILVTGSTGFLGKILTEKLLRSCSIKNMVVLVRSKKGLTAQQRVSNIYEQSTFDRLRKEKPDFMNKIKVIDGSLDDTSMNLSSSDRIWMIENVNFVFHCAATIKFNEPLETAITINIQGTANVLTLAKEMKNLKGFVHVSTAYSHCPRSEIKEQYYSIPITTEQLKTVDESTLNILEKWPNTYTFTKAITENLIAKNENHLPISIFRPSIIGCTKSEPQPGWLENMNGPPGLITGVMVGFLRTVPVNPNKVVDIIPADYTVNALISVMWDTVNRYQDSNGTNEEPKIYNFVSGAESPLTLGRYVEEMHASFKEAPTTKSLWYPFYIFCTTLWISSILRFVLHRIPAAIVDSLLIISGKSPKMLKMYARTESMVDLLRCFSTEQWDFDNSNTRELWASLSQEDRNTFCFSLENFDWKSYIKIYYHGIRKYILHEDLSNIAEASAKFQKLYWLHKSLIGLIFYLVFLVCRMLISY